MLSIPYAVNTKEVGAGCELVLYREAAKPTDEKVKGTKHVIAMEDLGATAKKTKNN